MHSPLYERTLCSNIKQCPGQFIGLSPNSCFSTYNKRLDVVSEQSKHDPGT